MPIKVLAGELPRTVRRSVIEAIEQAFADADDEWQVNVTPDSKNNAWDVEVYGPDTFRWARRFSGEDRDTEVIMGAIRAEVVAAGKNLRPQSPELNNALSALAIQGIAFTSDNDPEGERSYTVDRVHLKESEIVYLHHQGALTTNGIQKYLLTRRAA